MDCSHGQTTRSSTGAGNSSVFLTADSDFAMLLATRRPPESTRRSSWLSYQPRASCASCPSTHPEIDNERAISDECASCAQLYGLGEVPSALVGHRAVAVVDIVVRLDGHGTEAPKRRTSRRLRAISSRFASHPRADGTSRNRGLGRPYQHPSQPLRTADIRPSPRAGAAATSGPPENDRRSTAFGSAPDGP